MDRDVSPGITKAYDVWAPYYDKIYGWVMGAGRKVGARIAAELGTEILDVGIGTGLSLLEYSQKNNVIGVDISIPMLSIARERINQHNIKAAKSLMVMDACRLGFKDQSFDVVVGQYIIAIVPNPEGALDEFARVLRPNGEIIITNHFVAEKGMISYLELILSPIAKKLGLNTSFPYSRVEKWAKERGFKITHIEHFGIGNFFTVVRMRDIRSNLTRE